MILMTSLKKGNDVIWSMDEDFCTTVFHYLNFLIDMILSDRIENLLFFMAIEN